MSRTTSAVAFSFLPALGVMLGLAGCGVGEISPDREKATRSFLAFPDLRGATEWQPMQVNERAMAVPYVSFKGYHVSGGDIFLPGSPALRVPGAETAPGEDELDLSQLASEGLEAPDDDDPQAALEAAEENESDDQLAERQTFGVTLAGVGRWAGRRVPYAISKQISSGIRSEIIAGMKLWKAAGVRFVRRAQETDYVFFKRSGGCASYLGRVGGKQPVWLADWADASSVAHELGHALGLGHEHQRDDRDKHIRIIDSNVPENWKDQLATYRSLGLDAVNLTAYDVRSLMHYPSYSGDAVDPDVPWLTLRNGEAIDWREKPTASDVSALNALYNR